MVGQRTGRLRTAQFRSVTINKKIILKGENNMQGKKQFISIEIDVSWLAEDVITTSNGVDVGIWGLDEESSKDETIWNS